MRCSSIAKASARVGFTPARVGAANDSPSLPVPMALLAAARQTGQCLEPFGSFPPPSVLPGTLVHSGIAPRIGSRIWVLRDEEGAQQNALAITLPMSATSAKQVQKLRYPCEIAIEIKICAAQKLGQSAWGVGKTLADAVSGKPHRIGCHLALAHCCASAETNSPEQAL